MFICTYFRSAASIKHSGGGGILTPDFSDEEQLPPEETDALTNGTFRAYTMIKNDTSADDTGYKMASYGSGYGINWTMNSGDDGTQWTNYTSSATDSALYIKNIALKDRYVWIKVPPYYHFHRAFLDNTERTLSASTTYCDDDFDTNVFLRSSTAYYHGTTFVLGGTKRTATAVIAKNWGSLTFSSNGGSGSSFTNKYYYGTTATLPSCTFTKPGYHFVRWRVPRESGYDYFSPGDRVQQDLLLPFYGNDRYVGIEPEWAVNWYSIRMELNGGTYSPGSIGSQQYDASFSVAAPTRTGYTFAGWTVTSGLSPSTAKWGTNSSTSSSITSSSTKCANGSTGTVYFKNLTTTNNGSVTLTANWEEKQYQLEINPNGGIYKGSSGVTLYGRTYFNDVNPIAPPTRAGYTFTGYTVTTGLNTSTAKWGTTSNPTDSISSTSTLCVNGTSSVYFKSLTTEGRAVLTANWTPNWYSVRFFDEYGNQFIGSTLPYLTLMPKEAKYWTQAADGVSIESTFPILPDCDLNIRVPRGYKVTFNLSGRPDGVNRDVWSVTYDATENEIENAIDNYLGTSSYINCETVLTKTSGNGKLTPSSIETSALSNFRVTWYDYEDDDSVAYRYGDIIAMPYYPAAFTNGKTFHGWYTQPNGQGTKITQVNTTTFGNFDLYAYCTYNTYTIKLNTNGGAYDGHNGTYTLFEGQYYDSYDFDLSLFYKLGYTFDKIILQTGKGDISASGAGIYSYSIRNSNATLQIKWKDTWANHAASAFDSGTGSKADPYIIKTAQQLAYMTKRAQQGESFNGEYLKLGANIDLADYEWLPIDNFRGNFDGNYCKISNITITTPKQLAGLFTKLENFDNKIEKFIIDSALIESYIGANSSAASLEESTLGIKQAGAIAGMSEIDLNNFIVMNSKIVAANAAGIVYEGLGYITDCKVADSTILCAGGEVAGIAVTGNIQNCSVIGGTVRNGRWDSASKVFAISGLAYEKTGCFVSNLTLGNGGEIVNYVYGSSSAFGGWVMLTPTSMPVQKSLLALGGNLTTTSQQVYDYLVNTLKCTAGK